MCSKADARKYLETYFKNTGRDADLKRLKTVPDKRIIDQAAWSVRVLSRGARLDDKSMASLEDRIQRTLAFSGSKDEEQTIVEKMEDDYKNEIMSRLKDGTEVKVLSKGDALSVGDKVLVKIGEDFVKAPEGKHELEGGLTIYTDAEGFINELETEETDKTTLS